MPGARNRAAVLLVSAAVAMAAAGCSRPAKLPKPSKAFCDAAKHYEDRITATKPASLDEQVGLVEQIDAQAPKDVRHDTGVFLDALRRRAAGDANVIDDPKIQKSVDNVNRRYSNGCGVFARKSPL